MSRRSTQRTATRLALVAAAALAPALAPGLAGAQVSPSDTLRADSVRVDLARPDSARVDSLRPDSLRADSTRADSAATPARRSYADAPATLRATLSGRDLVVMQDGQEVKHYRVAVGKDAHPTPRGTFQIRRIVWNPSWTPPDEKWARGKTPKGPGHPANPMKVVKIFFKQPDYYIHGTGAVESLGTAASHGCLRMDPMEAAEVAQIAMESGGSSFGWDTVRRWLRLGSTRAVTLKRPVTLVIEG